MLRTLYNHRDIEIFKCRYPIYRRGDLIVDHSRSYKLLSGLVGLGVHGEKNLFTVVGIVCENEYFGDEVILMTEKRRHDAIALVESVVVHVTLDSEMKKTSLYRDSIRRNERLETLYSMRRVVKRVEYVTGLINCKIQNRMLAEIVSALPETSALAKKSIEGHKK